MKAHLRIVYESGPGPVAGHKTRVLLNGEELDGIVSADIKFDCHAANRVILEILPETLDLVGVPKNAEKTK